jgi:hypothetical protein
MAKKSKRKKRNAAKALTKFGQGIANREYRNYLNLLLPWNLKEMG